MFGVHCLYVLTVFYVLRNRLGCFTLGMFSCNNALFFNALWYAYIFSRQVHIDNARPISAIACDMRVKICTPYG